MGQALYRKYRSKSLAEVVGQEHITATLGHALKTGKISHAYLFTGPRGTGKTSIARILAHEINGLSYDDDSAHLDIIEIDAASNRRIDEIRDLRDKVNIAPTSAKYKVYIIDEVHMLTREAFNALLKTLEEPPAHVVFILATTEAHKLPETIISRTQRFTFKLYPLEQVAGHLKELAKQEKIDISDEALAMIAAYGEGSFRDSISLLDQARGHHGTVGADYVRSLIGVPTEEAIVRLFEALQSHDAAATHHTLESLRDQGFNSAQTAKHLSKLIRTRLMSGQPVAQTDFILLQKLLEVPAAHDVDAFLELTLLEYALTPTLQHSQAVSPTTEPAAKTKASPTELSQPAPKTTTKPHSKTIEKPEKTAPEKPAEKPAEKPTPKSAALAAPIADEDLWPQVLGALKRKYNTLYGVARMARVEITNDSVVLYLKFAFHQKRLSESKNHAIITDIMKHVTGHDISLRCELETSDNTSSSSHDDNSPPTHASSNAGSENANPIATISNIFGGAELLES